MNLKLLILLGIVTFIAVASSCNLDSKDLDSVPKSSSIEKHYSGFLLATDFVIGANRFPFALLSMDGKPLKGFKIKARFYSVNNGDLQFTQEAIAEYLTITHSNMHQHLDGSMHLHENDRGFYVIDSIYFDQPGISVAEFTLADDAQSPISIQSLAFEVSSNSKAPRPGDHIPPWTASNQDTLNKATENLSVEPSLSHVTLEQAVNSAKPMVIAFSSPMFCTSQMCGPVTDIVSTISQKYDNELDFIHIEPYDLEIAQKEGRLVPTGIFSQWELPSEPWVFLINSGNRITDRYEGLFTEKELESSILNLLDS